MPSRTMLALAAVAALLAAVFFYVSRPEAPVEPDRLPFVWQFSPEDLTRVAIALPREGKAESFVRRGERDWAFEASGELVDPAKWGLGIPLLLSGPRAARIVGDVDDAKRDAYGLASPRVDVTLVLKGGDTVHALIGDATPDGTGDYASVEGSATVFTISPDWAAVVERLVREPPRRPSS